MIDVDTYKWKVLSTVSSCKNTKFLILQSFQKIHDTIKNLISGWRDRRNQIEQLTTEVV